MSRYDVIFVGYPIWYGKDLTDMSSKKVKKWVNGLMAKTHTFRAFLYAIKV